MKNMRTKNERSGVSGKCEVGTHSPAKLFLKKVMYRPNSPSQLMLVIRLYIYIYITEYLLLK